MAIRIQSSMTKKEKENFAKKPQNSKNKTKNSFKQEQYNCINPTCKRRFNSYKALSIHFDKSECSNIHQYNTPYIQKAVMDSKPAAKPLIQNKHKTNYKFGIDPDYQNATSDESQNYLYPETTDDDITYNILHSTSNASINTNTSQQHIQNIQNTPKHINSQYSEYTTPFTNAMYAESKLLKILNDANTPNYLFQQIMNWAKESQQKKYQFNPPNITKKECSIISKNGIILITVYHIKFLSHSKKRN